ncbi:MAG: PAS domain S-box protein [Thermomicrobiales bacterium]
MSRPVPLPQQPWPQGDSEMARRIREHDWAVTPLGPAAAWPQSLRTVVELVVASGFPMIALWGPDLIQLYNDGYRDVMGRKHPEGLGQPTRDCWPEVWNLNEPIYARVWAGETVTLEDALYPITRSGVLEDAWFTLSYSPLRDERGEIAGVLVTVIEMTARLQAEAALARSAADGRRDAQDTQRTSAQRIRHQRDAFQAAMDGAPLAASLNILARIVTEETGGAARSAFFIANAEGASLRPIMDAGDMPPSYLEQVNAWPIGVESFACGLATATGQPVLTHDVREETVWQPWLHVAERYGFRAPWSFPIATRDGRPVGTFAMYWPDPREATPDDVTRGGLIAQAAAIIIARHIEAEERARAEHALSASEETYRALVDESTARQRAEAALRESEARLAFLLTLSDSLRSLADPADIQQVAMKLLAEHHDVMRAMYLEVHADGYTMTPAARYERDAAPTPDRLRLSDYGPDIADAFRAGRTLCVRDTEAAESEAQRAAYRAIGVRAWIVAPLVKEGRLLTVVGVQSRTPRDWTRADIQLVEDVADRTWAAVERARAEDALRDSEERFRTFAEYATDTLWIVDAESGQLEYLSPAYDQMWGEPREAVMRDISRWAALVHPEDRARASGAIRRVMTGEISPLVMEYRIVRPADGAIRWIHDTGFAIRDAAGNVRRIGGIAQDLTDKKIAETALRQSEAMIATVLQTAPVAIGFFGDNGQILLANPLMHYYLPSGTIPSRDPERLGRWTATDAEGQPVAPEDFPGARALRGLATIPGLEMRYRDDDGRVTWARVSSMPLPDEQGHITRQVSVITDIDALKQTTETLQRRVREATAELRTLSRRLLLVQEEERRKLALELHDEIGQALTGLTFQLAAAEGRGDGALAEVNVTVQALTEQVRQMALELRPQVLDRYGLLAAIEWFRTRYQATTGITVHLREQNVAQRRYPPEIEIAAFRVVQEALTNVARHAGVGEAWVSLFSDGVLLAAIRDEGRGFDAAQVRDSSGVGGMQERVHLLGGAFDLETAPGEGVRITAEFPLATDAPSEEAAP